MKPTTREFVNLPDREGVKGLIGVSSDNKYRYEVVYSAKIGSTYIKETGVVDKAYINADLKQRGVQKKDRKKMIKQIIEIVKGRAQNSMYERISIMTKVDHR